MTPEREARRLAAILAADMVGYSRLMEADERGIIARQKAHRNELIDPEIASHNGRIVKTTGDGLLVEFASVVDATECAVAIQRAMLEREADKPEEHRIRYRIGVNTGDVVIDGDDILGDGVNVAARLEGLAEPGGICLPRKVFHEVRTKLDVGYAFIGEQKVKNIETPIPVYRVLLEPDAAGTVIGEISPSRPRWQLRAVGALVVALIAAGGLAWWQPWAPDVNPASVERMAFPLPQKPSIAVLPFDNLSGDPEQEYFADGLTDSLITTLSQVSNLFVIARNSTFTYKGKPAKVQTVAQDLGVRYVLEGSFQRSGDRVRINAQLVDALTGRHMWAEEYDRDATDIFALQDNIKENVFVTLNVKLTEGEQARIWRRATTSFKAYQLYLQAKQQLLKFDKSTIARARQLYQKALDLDPEFTEAWEEIGWSYYTEVVFGWSKTPAADLARAEALARKVMKMDPENPGAHNLLGEIMIMKGGHDEGVALCEKAVALAPNKSEANAVCARINVYAGNAERALELVEVAMRQSPYHPSYYLFPLGAAHRMLGGLEKSIAAFKAAMAQTPGAPWPYIELAATYAMAGRDVEARAAGAELLKRFPKFTVSGSAKRLRYRDAEQRRRILDGLRKAGLPEHPPLGLPDKPSIAVLPFTNMSGDAEQEYFADGMTEDLITDLSRISGLFVIARNSTFTYKGSPVTAQQVGGQLGVRYVLEGSVRRAGDKVRINAKLVDATTGGHLWAERYDGELKDIFALQDRVTTRIVAALAVKLSASERALAEQTETSVPEAYDAFLAGWRHFRARTVEDYRTALVWLEKAVALDPDYGRAWAALASLYLEAFQRDWLGELGIDYARLPDLLEKAMKRPTPLAYQVEAERLVVLKRFDEAKAMLDMASALDPNDPDIYVLRSTLVALQGDAESAIALMKTAMRLDPHYPAFDLYRLGALYLRANEIANAIAFLERARTRNPEDWSSLVYLTAAYAEAGRLDDAEQTAKALVERRKELGFLVTLTGSFGNWYTLNGAFGERVVAGLRKAGIRDKARPEDLNLSPEYRLSGEELREALKTGYRNKGRIPAGVWMRDMDPQGNGVHYWNGIKFATSTSEIRGDVQYSKRSNGMEQTCNFYRNPKGTKENLDEFVAVCSNGVFPHARFPLPQAAQQAQ